MNCNKWIRSLLTLSFFILFGIGGLLLSYLILPFVRKRTKALKIVRFIWQIILKGFIYTRLIDIDTHRLDTSIQGAVILANHPSLIDVIILTALFPKTFSVAKSTLRKNPFMGLIVQRVFLPDDVSLMEEAPALLSQGYNILIFPEGTRSPSPSSMRKWHRGAIQLALRTQAPILPVVLHYQSRMLAKGQSILDMGGHTIHINVKNLPLYPPPPITHDILFHEAKTITNTLSEAIQSHIK